MVDKNKFVIIVVLIIVSFGIGLTTGNLQVGNWQVTRLIGTPTGFAGLGFDTNITVFTIIILFTISGIYLFKKEKQMKKKSKK